MIKINFSQKEPLKTDDRAIVTIVGGEDSFFVLKENGKEIRIGINDKKDFNRRKLITTARRIISLAKNSKVKKIALRFEDFISINSGLSIFELAQLIAENFEMANFEFIKYKTQPKEGWNFIKEILIWGNVSGEAKRGFKKGQLIGDEVNKCRELANTPGGEMTPSILAKEAKKAIKGTKITVKVLGMREMRSLKMGGILGVASGSNEEPKFIILEYKGASEDPIVLIGKGVTFDTGGLNLKTGDFIYEMHMDMSGGASVIHAITLAAKLGIKKRIIGLIPAAENMPSGSSYRPGDVLKSMSGKTIEVLNTDAEGRIILADALTYSKRYNPKVVIDVATLTGAAMVALGNKASAIFSRDEKLIKKIEKAGEESGDYVWQLPLWDEYEDEVKGTFGDVANVSKSRYGGAINGAMFLYQFAKDLPWAHIDIAPRMTSSEGEYLAKGAAGAGVRLLTRLLEIFSLEK